MQRDPHAVEASSAHPVYTWREQLLEGGSERLSGNEERTELADLRKHVRELERTLGRKTYELEILANGFRTWE